MSNDDLSPQEEASIALPEEGFLLHRCESEEEAPGPEAPASQRCQRSEAEERGRGAMRRIRCRSWLAAIAVRFLIAFALLDTSHQASLGGGGGGGGRAGVVNDYEHVTAIRWTTVTAHDAATPIPTPLGTVTSIGFWTVRHTAAPTIVPT